MRRLFSFKSSSSSSGNSNSSPPAPTKEKVYWEIPWVTDAKNPMSKKVQDGSKPHKDSVLKTVEGYTESGDLCNSHHRRSLSFSSSANNGDARDGSLNSLTDLSRPQSTGENSPCHAAECPVHCNSPTSEKYTRTKRGDLDTFQLSHAAENPDSPCSSRGQHFSSGNSPPSSPIPLRCRSARLQQIINNSRTLDLYIDGEHEESKSRRGYQKLISDSGNDDYLAEHRAPSYLGRPPRVLSTAPSSPTYSKEYHRSYSFKDMKDIHRHRQLYTHDKTNDFIPTSPHKPSKRNDEKLLFSPSGKYMMRSRDFDSQTTTTVEDIYEDSSNLQPSSISTGTDQQNSTDFTLPYDNYCSENPLSYQGKHYFFDNGLMGIKSDIWKGSGLYKQNTEEELVKKLKEIERLLSTPSLEGMELEGLSNSSSDVLTLLQTIRKITESRRYLAFELASQINCRIAERSSAKEGLKQAKLELDTRTRRLEKEKAELQSSLEKELDRRSNDWSLKLEKFQSEEQRLRERVRELAEQNVSLQRDISSLKGNEVDSQSRIMISENKLNDVTASLEEVRTENDNLHQTLSELQERFNGAEEDRDSIRRSYKEKEKENKELQKVIVRLQRVCSEQDKTISGLRQGYSDEIGKQSIDRVDNLSRLQMEQIRLTGVEQMLRKEVDSCRHELDSLRHEHVCLLDRLQDTGNGCGFSLVKLDEELRARIGYLQTRGLTLLDDNSHFFGELLGLIKHKQCEYGQEATDFDSYSIVEYTVKYQNLRRELENFRRSLQSTLKILNEKSDLEALECDSQTTKFGGSRQPKNRASEDDLELELKAETMLTKVLREKLCSKELELEQSHSDLASAIRAHGVLQAEIQRLQDELSCLNHKTKDMELQILRKDESISQLQHDLQECTKELTATRSILMKVSGERDHIWEEVKRSRETIMLLNLEVKSLKKKIEALDEDMLIKDGEISILKDSLVDKPFDTIFSPKSVKQFALE